jgi:hypothetical protein
MATPDWMQAHDERALSFEQQAEEQTSAAVKLLLADAARRLAAEYIRAAGDLKTPVPDGAKDGLRAAVLRILAALASGMVSELPRIVEGLQQVIEGGLKLGTRAAPKRPARVRLRPSRELTAAIRKLRTQVREQLAAAEAHARAADLRRFSDVTTVMAKAQQAVNSVSAAARWASNRAVNEGAAAVADAAGVPRLWVAEAGACLTCLAYAGELAQPGEPFPAGLTFGDSSTVTEALDHPPAHPNCRCRIQPWYGTEPSFGIELPTALKREAQRAVLRGTSDHASRPAKLRAADRLLKTGLSGLPDTVKIRARAKVKAGPAAWKPAKRPAATTHKAPRKPRSR